MKRKIFCAIATLILVLFTGYVYAGNIGVVPESVTQPGMMLSYNGVDCGTSDPCTILPAPSAGNQYHIYRVNFSRADDSTDDSKIKCEDGTIIDPIHSMKAGGEYGFNIIPYHIVCPIDNSVVIDWGTAPTDGSASIQYKEITP